MIVLRARCVLSSLLVCVSVAGCGGGKGPVAPPAPPPLATASLLAITQGPGARWMVLANPAALFEGPLAGPLRRVIPNDGLDRLAKRIGLDVRKVREAIVVGYAATTFYLARVPEGTSPSSPIEAFERRAFKPSGRSSPRPDVLRAWGTLASGTPASAAALWSTHGDVVAGEGGRLGPVLASMALAAGKLAPARAIAADGTYTQLATWAKGAPLAVVARCPIGELLAPGNPGGDKPIVAEECEGAALAARPESGGKLAITLRIQGHWGKDAKLAEEEVRAAIVRIVGSDLGKALGLREAAPAEVSATADAVSARIVVDAQLLADGVQRLAANEIVDATK